MTTTQDMPETTRPIPQRLIEPLRIVAGRASMLAVFRALFKLFALCALVWLAVVLILGSRMQVPAWIAVPLGIVAWGAVVVGGFYIFRPVVRRRRDLASAAWLVDSAAPETEERISSAIEISQEKEAVFRGSPELVACLIRQAEHHADTVDPRTLISGKDVLRWFIATLALLFVWFVLLVVMMPNILLGLQRLMNPWSAASALPAPVLKVGPGDQTLTQGEDFAVTVDVEPPEGLSLDNGNEQIERATLTRHFTNPTGAGAIPDISEEMQRTGNRSFQARYSNVQQSFTYTIVADGGGKIGRGQSPDYTVKVQTRPSVADLEILYTYPAYTHLQPRTDHSREGAIEAVVGTTVRLVVHTSEPAKAAKLAIEDAGGGPLTLDLVPVNADLNAAAEAARAGAPAPQPGAQKASPVAPSTYAAEFKVVKSSQYHIQLTNADGRDNPDSRGRSINARPDRVPDISIVSPDARIPVRVRPDDSVPLHYLASDDFGISKIEARVRVDDRPQVTLSVPITTNEARVDGDWNLDLAAVLRASPGATEPHRIVCELVSSDNREPDAQSSVPARLTLDLDKATTPLAQRLDVEAAKSLAAAIQSAGEKLKDAQSELDALKSGDTKPRLGEKESAHATTASRDLIAARDDLNRAANDADPTRLRDAGRLLRDLADNQVQRAEEQTVKTQLAAEQADERKESTASAQRDIKDALDRLDQLSGAIKQAAQKQPLAQALENLADEQRKLAEGLAQTPNDPKLLARQKELQQQLEKLIKDNPQLQQPAADANRERVNQLAEKLRDINQAQRPIAEQLNNENSAAASQEKLKDLAQQQEQLNKDMKQFAQQQSEALKQAGAQPPDPAKVDPIVKELQENKLVNAARDQKAAAGQLDQAANRLDNEQKRLDNTAGPRQKAADQASQDAKTATDLQQRVRDLTKQLQDPKNQTDLGRRSDPRYDQARNLADEIKRDAQKMAQNKPAQTAAQASSKAADSAKIATQTPNAQKAAQELSEAANQLANAAQAEQQAAGVPPGGSPPSSSPGQAAQEAKALADKERALADQSAQLTKSQAEAEAARNTAAATAQRQQALADRIAQAQKDAQDLQQQTQGAAPELSQRAGQAAQPLQQAAQAQRDAADSTRANDPQKAAARQEQSEQKVGDAQQSLTGERPPGMASSPATPRGSPASPAPPRPTPGQSASATPPGSNPPSNATPPQGANPGQSPSAQSPSQSPSAQGPSAQSPSAQSPSAQSPSQTPGQSPSQPPGQSGQPSNSSSASGDSRSGTSNVPGNSISPGLTGTSNSQGNSGSSPTGTGTPTSSSNASSAAQSSGSPGSAPGSGATPNAGSSPGMSAAGSQSGSDPAAEAVQSARNAQSQAASGNPAAARQAAEQLSRASQQLMPTPGQNPGQNPGQSGATGQGDGQGQGPANPTGMAGQPGTGQSGTGRGQGGTGGTSAGGATGRGGSGTGSSAGSAPNGSPGTGSGGGVGLTDRAAEMPQEVKDVGISPSDWARLPPQMQDQLLHSAQQPGPPGYRDMIKSYYSRIARLPPDPGTAK